MAVNNNPTLAWGRDIPPELLAQILALKPGDAFWNTPMEVGVGESAGTMDPRLAAAHSWELNPGDQFSPRLSMDQIYGSGRTEAGGNRLHDNGNRVGTGTFNELIFQPRNVSTWGNSDATGQWDTSGKWLGFTEDKTALRGLGDMALMALASNYAPDLATDAGKAFGQAGSKAVTGAASGAGSTYMMGGDTDAVVKAALAGGVGGAIGGYGADQGWSKAATKAASGAATTALKGGSASDILKNAGTSFLTSGMTGNTGNTVANISGDGSMDFSSQFDPSLYDFGQDFASQDFAGSFDWDSLIKDLGGDGTQAWDWFSSNSDQVDWGNLGKSALQWLLKGNGQGAPGWANLLGAGLGAMSAKDKNQTVTREPWAPAQPFLKQLLAEGQGLFDKYKAQPFSPAQQSAYANIGGLLDSMNANAGAMFAGPGANASGANQYVRGQPRGLVGSAYTINPQFLKFGDFGTR